MCEQEAESIAHSLLLCNSARQVWNKWEGCPVNLDDNCWDFSEAAMRILNAGTARDLELFIVVAWSIWYNRNQKCFEDKFHSPNQVWHHAKRMISEHKEAAALLNGRHALEGSRWMAPPLDFHKINVDGASSDDGRRSSIGVVIRNCKGEAVAALSKVLPGQYTSLETEFIALQEGVLLARELKLPHVIIESDSLIAIQSLQALNIEGGVGHLCQGILNLMDSFKSWNFKHLKRDYNKVAHDLAQYARQNGMSQVWKGVSPPMVQHLITLDCVAASHM
ncbi:uncharacterized protein LOC126688624 [Quercus robur]|uniref:uncharacterized protein LOC126688624 n=1 Tax=Quercus robur TaxID=38942 RepID=UPI0021613B5A|nr:uncharacterized protein LOC126688624 [Quercus robur]